MSNSPSNLFNSAMLFNVLHQTEQKSNEGSISSSVPGVSARTGLLRLRLPRCVWNGSKGEEETCIRTPNFSLPVTLGGVPLLTPDIVLSSFPPWEHVLHYAPFDDPLYKTKLKGSARSGTVHSELPPSPHRFLDRVGLQEYACLVVHRSTIHRSSVMSSSAVNPRRIVEDTIWGRKELSIPITGGTNEASVYWLEPVHTKPYNAMQSHVSRVSAKKEHHQDSATAGNMIYTNAMLLRTDSCSSHHRQAGSCDSATHGDATKTQDDATMEPIQVPFLVATHSITTIADVFQAVQNGVDLICSDLIFQLARDGVALNIPPVCMINGIDEGTPRKESTSLVQGPRLSYLNLRDLEYELDATPLLKDCKCKTCQRHTRAYIHHLLNVHELNAHILVLIHNIASFHTLFEDLQRNISRNTFDTYKSRILGA